uniref:UPAR/Ly6 domain-containing protein n=1 Tax=Strongyloides stercoralis TaxID=6248 RepID=A0A0K0E3A8_STRER
MFSNILYFIIIIYFLIISEEVYSKNALKCYYCGVRKKGTQNWISFSNETCKIKVVTCTKSHVACVKARVFDHSTQFIITGCSEDKFTGCDQSELTPGGAKLERCQCESNLCNNLEEFKANNFKFSNDNKVQLNNGKLDTYEKESLIVTEDSYNKFDQSITNKYKDDSKLLNKKIETNAITSSTTSFTLFFVFSICFFIRIYI